MSSVSSRGRFELERLRLGYRSANALAKELGVAHTTVKRIEEGGGVGGEVLTSFARLGADVQFILTGERRAAGVDLTLFGVAERALVEAFERHAEVEAPGHLRARHVAIVYNDLLKAPPDSEVGPAALAAADRHVLALDDPMAPETLVRLLFGGTAPVQAGAVSQRVTGDGNRLAGRDYTEGKASGRKRK